MKIYLLTYLLTYLTLRPVPIGATVLLLLLLFDDAPVCRRVTVESWARAVKWKVSEMQVSKDE